MTAALNSYLQQHKSISIPGLGTIYIERTPALTDFTNRQLLPPGFHYRFDRYADAPDKDFFSFLAIRKNIADYEAMQWYNDWATDLRNRIRSDDQVVWEGVGVFKKDLSGDIVFEASAPLVSHLYPVPAERIIRSDAAHTMLVGDKEVTNVQMSGYLNDPVEREKSSWWIYALIIAALALIILFYHFYKNGFNTSSAGSQQKVVMK
jgi:hypothetical protein